MTNPASIKIRTKKLGILLKDARLSSGKTIDDCASILSVSGRTIEEYESGNSAPSLPELETLAYYFDIPLSHFWSKQSLAVSHSEKKDTTSLQRLVPLRTRIVCILLRKARIDAGLTITEVAERTNITAQDIETYENGKTPIPLPKLEMIANVLGVSIDYFFDTDGIVGEWLKQRKAFEDFVSLPSDLQNFVIKPVNKPYLEIAQRMSGMSVEQLRGLAEGLLDITY